MLGFFNSWQSPRIPAGLRAEGASVDYQNIDNIEGCLLEAGRCTRHELKTIYSVEDTMMMYESVMVPRINEWLAMERAKAKR